MKRRLFKLAFLWLPCFVFSQANSYVQYVKPLVGTGGHGHTFPGGTVPFGMVQLSPDTRNDGSWDGCSGYHYSDTIIYGFSHTHLSGTGCSDYGDILLMPTMKKPSWDRSSFPSAFSHKTEKATPGYYAVTLKDDKINVELTSTTRVGVHKYTFAREGSASVFLDLTHRDKLLGGEIKMVDEKTAEVYRVSEAWAKEQYVYARIEFSKPVFMDKNTTGNKAHFSFPVKKGESILVKVAISGVGYDGAKKNMEKELPGWDFEKTKDDAQSLWNKELGKIEVIGKNISDLENFYTALYHCMIHPNISNDVDGQYRGNDLKVHTATHDHYTVFSLWDTFRGLHPLLTIIDQKRVDDIINSFLDIYNESGILPVWELSGNETYCMIGYHSASVIADALRKGIGNFDTLALFNALVKSANMDKFGIKQYAQKGYLSSEDEPESVSKTLEYAYDDFCIAQIASILRKSKEEHLYLKRSENWKNLFDDQSGFMRPRFNGGWISPFDPKEVNNHFTEANSWQYSFFVPQDINGLIEKSGGDKKFEKKLDRLFSESSKTTGRDQADITGLIGQYAHGNEPSHHMAYLYNYAHAPQKAQKIIWDILHKLYKPKPDGLCGNEDCGQMSAWFVWSSMGFYPVTPGIPQYAIGTCLFDEVKIHLENGKTFTVKAQRQKPGDFYVGSISLSNNQFQPKLLTLAHADIMRGGVFQFNLISDSSKVKFGKPQGELVFQPGDAEYLVEVPVITAPMVFKDSATVKISTTQVTDKLYYSLNDSPYKLYEKYFTINNTTKVKAFTVRGSEQIVKGPDTSSLAVGTYSKMKHPDWKIKYNCKYNHQYTGGGDEALIDGLKGDENWRGGFWQGFQGHDLEVVIDMGKVCDVNSISTNFLQDSRSWILFPSRVEYSFSENRTTFGQANEIKLVTSPKDEQVVTRAYTVSGLKTKARYVKVKAINFGKLPNWHQGKGGNAFIFADEIDIK